MIRNFLWVVCIMQPASAFQLYIVDAAVRRTIVRVVYSLTLYHACGTLCNMIMVIIN